MIRLTCPNADCGHKFGARDEAAGKRVKCPKCQKPVAVPGPMLQTPRREPEEKGRGKGLLVLGYTVLLLALMAGFGGFLWYKSQNRTGQGYAKGDTIEENASGPTKAGSMDEQPSTKAIDSPLSKEPENKEVVKAEQKNTEVKSEPWPTDVRGFRLACAKASTRELKGKEVAVEITYYHVDVLDLGGTKQISVGFKERYDGMEVLPGVEVSLQLALTAEGAATWNKLEPQTRVLVKGQVKDVTRWNITRRKVDTAAGKLIENPVTDIKVHIDNVTIQKVVGKGDPAQEEAKKKLREWAGELAQPVAKHPLLGVWDCPGHVQYEFRPDGLGLARGAKGTTIDHMFVYALKGNMLRMIRDHGEPETVDGQYNIELNGDRFKMTAPNGYATDWTRKQ